MIFQDEFFNHDILRNNFGWASPNYAGAFVATLLPFCWTQSKSRRIVLILSVVEAIGVWMLCKTESRGALVAIAAAAIYYLGPPITASFRAAASFCATRGILLTIFASMTNLSDRLSLYSATYDASIWNRIRLWKGGLEMIATNPHGWGIGESGRAFANWFQPVNDTHEYITMVNGYLEVAVSCGLLVFGASIVLSLYLLLLGRSYPSGRLITVRNAGASIAAWATGNCFSTLWIEPMLWIVPAIAILIIVTCNRLTAGARYKYIAFLMWAIMGSLVVVGVLYIVGRRLKGNDPLFIAKNADNTVGCAFLSHKKSDITWEIWPDSYILGEVPGKRLRSLITKCGSGIYLKVHSTYSERRSVNINEATNVMLFGIQTARIADLHFSIGHQKTLIICPTVAPPWNIVSGQTAGCRLILPEIDDTGLCSAWRDWAAKSDVEVVSIAESSSKIGWCWPDRLLSAHLL
jgi:hypothetical protein